MKIFGREPENISMIQADGPAVRHHTSRTILNVFFTLKNKGRRAFLRFPDCPDLPKNNFRVKGVLSG